MPDIGTPSLEQLRVFLTIVEEGSFSAAARKLNRQQSVVSYAVANLEAQLGGLSLFERRTRRPTLTEAGRAILADARQLGLGVDSLRARARGLLSGLEAEVAIAVDVMMPTCRLVSASAAFRERFPTVNLRLYVEALGAVTQLVLDRTCSVGVSGPTMDQIDGLEMRPIGCITMIRVAAPGHPLACWPGKVPQSEVRKHVQLVLTDRTDRTKGRDFGVLSPQTWRLGDLGAKHALLIGGLGWGSMPARSVRSDIAAGRLVPLDIENFPAHRYPFAAIHRGDQPPGPAARWMLDQFSGATADEDLGEFDEPPHVARDMALV